MWHGWGVIQTVWEYFISLLISYKIDGPRHAFYCCTVEDELLIVGDINLVNEAFFARTFYFMLMRGRQGWQQATKKHIGGYRSRVRVDVIVITIICITIACFICFILYPACTLCHPWRGWRTTDRRRIWWKPLLELIIFESRPFSWGNSVCHIVGGCGCPSSSSSSRL